MDLSLAAVTQTSDIRLVLNKNFLDIQATIESEITLISVRDIIRTNSQMHRPDKYSQHSSIICPVWINGWVLIYELSGCGFESRCSHLNIGKLFKFLNVWVLLSLNHFLAHYLSHYLAHYYALEIKTSMVFNLDFGSNTV